jgi:hypothetical protein
MTPEEINLRLSQLLQAPLPTERLAESLAGFSSEDWALLLAVAYKHKVLPMLHPQLGALPPDVGVPQEVSEKLRRLYLLTMAANVKLLSGLGQVLAAFKARGLEVIVLKGAYLLEHAYAHLGGRGMEDIDLLVHQADLAAVISCLQALGYHMADHFDPLEDNRDLKHMPHMINRTGLILEVHWSLLREIDPIKIDLEGIWTRAVPTCLEGVDALVMCSEDLLLHLCLHGTYQHNLRHGLRPLVDLQQVLLSRQDQINWDQLVRTARAWGAERVVGLTFHLLDRVLACPPPPGVMAALLPGPIEPERVERALEALFHQPENSAAIQIAAITRLSTSQGVKTRIGLVLGQIFLPKQQMARLYGLPAHSWRVFFYYPLRFVQLIVCYAGPYLGLLKSGPAGLENSQAADDLLNDKNVRASLKHWMAKQ